MITTVEPTPTPVTVPSSDTVATDVSFDVNESGVPSDVEALISLMPNKSYGNLIRLRYLEQKTNVETANELGMSMDNYYNAHLRAKAQYKEVCRKEEHRHG